MNLDDKLNVYENTLIAEALSKAKGSKTIAATLLGIKRTTLVMRLKAKGLLVNGQRFAWTKGRAKRG